MRIFIDESGPFTGQNNISAVGALVIPDQAMAGFEKLYGRLRRTLPQDKGEVKGRLLKEHHVDEVCGVLRKVGCLFEVVAVDSTLQTEAELGAHKIGQAEGMTKNLTDKHHKSLIEEVWELRRQLEAMSLQLYLQSCAMVELVYNVLNNATLYHSLRLWKELGEYHWIIDGKERDKVTPWEEWWSQVLLPLIEAKSLKEPFMAIDGGNYQAYDRFRAEDPDDYKKQFFDHSSDSAYHDLRLILKEDFRFSSNNEYGLEAADILVNTIRRSLAGNFGREGWLPVRELMVHRNQHYIRLISLGPGDGQAPKISEVPYRNVLSDFRSGGKSMLTTRLQK